MKSRLWLSACALAVSLAPSLASADEPPTLAQQVQQRVESELVRPLADFEGSHFSRVRPPPRERRVRVIQTAEVPDRAGRAFVPFAVDVRFGSGEWHENDIVGCAYMRGGDLFVKRGDAWRPASLLLGKNVGTVEGVCEAAPPRA